MEVPGLLVLLGAEWVMACSYLAGVNVAFWVTSTQVVGVDVPCIPVSAVAELEIDELDPGLLQVISFTCSCEQRKE